MGYTQLQELCHQMAMFVATDGIGLTVLWYGLNWCEPKWQAIRRLWVAEGHPYGLIATIVHVPTFVLAFIDLLLIKERDFLLEVNPRLSAQVQAIAIYAGCYIVFLVINKQVSGVYPVGLPRLARSSCPFMVCLPVALVVCPFGAVPFS